ncbi:hypothetical protein HG530_011029 [Fusarium avenaceum]|nr:hypothetical protein HG530_011029 [Fusarium avenaceum]
MAPVYKIAVIQFEPKDIVVEENFAKAESHLRSAAAKGCDIAILPEFHLTSWVPEHPEFVSASKKSNDYLSKYQDLAKELNINIVPGTICEVHQVPDSKDEELRNMTYFLAAGTGEICGSYQKKNLWHPERPHLTSSTHTPHTAFDTPLKHADGRPVRAGLIICWDLAFPEAFKALVNDGADIILIPSYWFMSDGGEEGGDLNPDSERIFLNCSLEATVGVRVRANLSALLNRRDNRHTSQGSELLVAAQAKVLVVKVLVDNTNHAGLAVVALLLRAVVPDGLLVLDGKLEDIGSLALLGSKVETGEETSAVGEGLAGLAEAGLSDGVVHGEEVPLDDVTNLGDHVVGIEAESTQAGVDGVGHAGESDGLVGVTTGCLGGWGRGDSGGDKESGGEDLGEHCDCWLW